jgi:hypothetical protein
MRLRPRHDRRFLSFRQLPTWFVRRQEIMFSSPPSQLVTLARKAAAARQHARDAQLAQTLVALAQQKRSIVTPAQIVRELQKNIPLPAPVNLQPELPSSKSPQTNSGNAPTGGAVQPPQPSPATTTVDQHAPGSAIIPRADLTPLYDFTLTRLPGLSGEALSRPKRPPRRKIQNCRPRKRAR